MRFSPRRNFRWLPCDFSRPPTGKTWKRQRAHRAGISSRISNALFPACKWASRSPPSASVSRRNSAGAGRIEPLLSWLPGTHSELIAHGIAIGILAYLLLTTFHVVLGEFVPKGSASATRSALHSRRAAFPSVIWAHSAWRLESSGRNVPNGNARAGRDSASQPHRGAFRRRIADADSTSARTRAARRRTKSATCKARSSLVNSKFAKLWCRVLTFTRSPPEATLEETNNFSRARNARAFRFIKARSITRWASCTSRIYSAWCSNAIAAPCRAAQLLHLNLRRLGARIADRSRKQTRRRIARGISRARRPRWRLSWTNSEAFSGL